PTSYQTAPSRVCVSAFYSGTPGCQLLISEKFFSFNRLAMLIECANRLEGAQRGPGRAILVIFSGFSYIAFGIVSATFQRG
ncbi:hypothetical protein, partial [Pseudomonas sp.]